MHGLIFETSVCYWQDQPDFYSCRAHARAHPHRRAGAFKVSPGTDLPRCAIDSPSLTAHAHSHDEAGSSKSRHAIVQEVLTQ